MRILEASQIIHNGRSETFYDPKAETFGESDAVVIRVRQVVHLRAWHEWTSYYCAVPIMPNRTLFPWFRARKA
jgi:hypothetical protein